MSRRFRRVVDAFVAGLKLAELIAPGQHGSLGATFGWFLRVGLRRMPHIIL